ncbi:MAG: AsmA family protein [Hyphomicrobiaceae bacterium]
MNTVLMWGATLLAAVLAALFAVPYFVDWNSYRGVFEEEASRILGRDVRVGGTINVRLLPTPYMRFEKLRIADTRLGASQPLFRADTFTIWLSVPPLLKGNLEASRVALDKPTIALAVDKSGTGNWTTLGIRPGTLPFIPQKVALQAVGIADGSVVLTHPRTGEVARVTGVGGEFSAEALHGPFKFSGEMNLAGTVRDVRIATSEVDAESTLRFKVAARPKDGSGIGSVYEIAGQVSGLSSKPEVSGTLTATLPLPELPSSSDGAGVGAGAAPANVGAGKPGLGRAMSVFADVKGQLRATADAVALTGMSASIENVGQPQLLTGEVSLDWGQLRRLDFSFSSRWLDFDRLAGAKGRASPVGTMAALINGLTNVLPAQSATRGEIAVDQLTLGGSPVANLGFAVSRSGNGALRIERLFAALPAGGRIAVDGALIRSKDATVFEGNLTAAGPSLSRLVDWGWPAGRLAGETPDSPFTLDGRLETRPDRISFSEAKATLGDHGLTGSASLSRAGELAVDVAAETFESDWLWKGGLKRDAVMAWLDKVTGRAGQAAAAQTGRPESATPASNVSDAKESTQIKSVRFKMRCNVLRGPDVGLRDVVVDIGAAGNVLRLNKLAFRQGNALDVDMTGHMQRQESRPKGHFSGTLRARDTTAVTMAMDLFGLPENIRLKQVAEMAPLQMAGRVTIGERNSTAVDIKADGAMQSGRIIMRAKIDGGLSEDWRAGPAEITLSGEHVDAERLLGLVFARPMSRSEVVSQDRHPLFSDVALTVVGVPDEGMVADGALSREGLTLGYNGRLRLDANATPTLDGTLEVAADRMGDLMTIAGVRTPGGGGGSPVTGTVGLSFQEDGRTKLSPSGLTVAGAEVSGTMLVARGEGGRLSVAGDIAVDQMAISGLVANLVASAPRPMPALPSDITNASASGVWTDQPFDPVAFDRFEGEVTATFGHLGLAPGLSLSQARLKLAFAPGNIEATILTSDLLDGSLNGQVAVTKAAAGARFKGELRVEGTKLAALSRAIASGQNAGGVAAGTLVFSGQALSPRSLIIGASGRGKLVLTKAWVDGLTPKSITETIAAGFDKQIEINQQTLEAEVLRLLPIGRLPLGSREINLDMNNGALRVAKFETETDNGRVGTLITVDLATLESETEWQLTASHSVSTSAAPWPPVSVFYTGKLGDFDGVTPRIMLGGFERELAVRRMEHEVNELERLRKLDEDRAHQERERQKALAETQRLERKRLEEAVQQRQRELKQQEQQPNQPGQQLEVPLPWPAAPSPAGSPRTESGSGSGPVRSNQASDNPPPASTAPSRKPSSATRRRPPSVQRPRPSAADTTLRSLTPGQY